MSKGRTVSINVCTGDCRACFGGCLLQNHNQDQIWHQIQTYMTSDTHIYMISDSQTYMTSYTQTDMTSYAHIFMTSDTQTYMTSYTQMVTYVNKIGKKWMCCFGASLHQVIEQVLYFFCYYFSGSCSRHLKRETLLCFLGSCTIYQVS